MDNRSKLSGVSAAGLIVTLGIIYGDIGTSPLYVLKAIIGTSIINQQIVLGAISCIFWTLTLQTSVKYIILTLRADNHGEGGIFSLYALIRRRAKWVMIPAIIGGSTLLADGIITPPISVSSAVEGLKILNPHIETIPIVIFILTLLFSVQQFGTAFIGKSFGPIMLIWFSMLAVLGLIQISHSPWVLKAINPHYAYDLLFNYPRGFWLLGAVFLCTTGAEALYSDLGHCGRANIRISWIFVKTCLLLNYFGQGAWLITQQGGKLTQNPFYAIMPSWFVIVGVIIATSAAIIASQALISGSYTLISEAMRLNFWPKVKLNFPTVLKGQLYIPSGNWMLWAGCVIVVLIFKESTNMEAAYGLSITITMLMTTLLLCFYLYIKKTSLILVFACLITYLTIELSFLTANLDKFEHGGWLTMIIGSGLFFIMWIWQAARKIKNRFIEFAPLNKYLPLLKELSIDESIPKYATNLVYLTSANFDNEIETKIIYSIINKHPKRADIYWIIHVHVLDDPYTMEYKVEHLIPDHLLKIEFRLGFRIEPKINLFFKQVVEDLVNNKEVDIVSRYDSLKKYNIIGDFRFVVIERVLNYDVNLSVYDNLIMDFYSMLKKLSLTEKKAFGLDTSNVTVEKVPFVLSGKPDFRLTRIKHRNDVKM